MGIGLGRMSGRRTGEDSDTMRPILERLMDSLVLSTVEIGK